MIDVLSGLHPLFRFFMDIWLGILLFAAGGILYWIKTLLD